MKRRDILKTAAAAFFSLATYVPARAQGANDRIAIGLIGCGGRGTGCVNSICGLDKDIQVNAVCDPNRNRAQKAQGQFSKRASGSILVTEDMRAVFDSKDIDVAWISTPEHWHTPAAILACQAGKHVYIEKNPSVNIWEGRQLVKAAAKYKRVVQVGFQNRSGAYGFSAREYVKSGKLGKIVTVKSYCMLNNNKWKPGTPAPVPEWLNWEQWLGPAPMRPYDPAVISNTQGWVAYWDFGGGALSDDGSHVMDLARMVIGDPEHPKSVYTWGGNHPFGGKRETPEYQEIVYDFGDFVMTCCSGYCLDYMTKTPGDVRFDSAKFPNWRNNATRTEIYGTEGLMYLGRHGGGWQVLGKGNEIVAQDGGVFPDKDHQKNFIDALRNGAAPNCDPEQGHRSAVLVHLGNISYRVGNKQLLFDGKTEQFTNSEEANVLARGKYRKGFEVPEEV